jgi:hypothetical protein
MRQTFRYVYQVSRDENPIRAKVPHRVEDTIMPGLISIYVQIGEMNGAMTGKRRTWVSKDGYLMIGQTPFPMGNETEHPIERLA